MGSSLERFLSRSRGTRRENRALFYLANWRYEFDDGDGVEELLSEIERSGNPAYKVAGRGLRRYSSRRGAVPKLAESQKSSLRKCRSSSTGSST